MKKHAGNLVLLLCTVTLCVFAVEGLLHLLPAALPLDIRQQLTTQRGVAHPYIGYLPTPQRSGVIASRDFTFTYHADGHGFRNPWPWPERADIVCLGDSLTFGYGVEDQDTWPAFLAELLPQLRVMNLGLSGAGPEQYTRVYETFGAALRPKLIIVGLYAGNDFYDTATFEQWVRAGSPGNYLAWRDFDKDGIVKSLLKRHSYLVHLALHTRTLYRNWAASEPKTLTLDADTRVQLRPSVIETLTQGAESEERVFQLALRALDRLHTMATAQGAHLLVVFQPTKERVYLPLLGETVPDPTAALRAALEARGMPFLDLFPVLHHYASKREQIFFEYDSHPNRQGYQHVAQAILAHIRQYAVAYGLNAS